MGARFQVLFHSPPGVLFTFPSRYWCAIGHMGVFRLGGWSPRVRTGFHVPGPTQDRRPRRAVRSGFAYGALTRCGRPSHAVPLPSRTCAGAAAPDARPATRRRNPAGYARSTVWPRSPFARRYSGNLEVDFFSSGYLDVSVPRVVLPAPMCSGRGYAHRCAWVRPFGDPAGRRVCVLLAGDYRSLPRPSSAPCAKASAVRPWYLAGPHRARGISTCR